MTWTSVPPGSSYSEIDGMDYYADWVFGSGEADFLPAEEGCLIPMILLLKDITARQFAQTFIPAIAGRGMERAPDTKAKPPRALVPRFYTEPSANVPVIDHFTALVDREFISRLRSGDGDFDKLRQSIIQIRLGRPLCKPALPDEDAGPEPEESEEPEFKAGPDTVVVGIIDDGIAFAHERFRGADGKTRIEYMWVQDGEHDHPAVGYGRELRKHDPSPTKGIDKLLADCTQDGFVDEDEIYRRAGLADFTRPDHKAVAWRAAHGTHVLDLATGSDPATAPENLPIVCVQLPVATTRNTSGALLDPYVLDGLRYILDRADAIARRAKCGALPVVVNFSYGTFAGPHDGTSPLEVGIDDLVRERKKDFGAPLEVVIPSGNNHLARCHAEVSFTEPETFPLHWRVQPDDRTSSFLEIWLPHRVQPPHTTRVALTILPPWGPESPQLGEVPGAGLRWMPGGQVLCEARYAYVPWPTERGIFLVALQPTARRAVASRIAPSGVWTVKLHNLSLGELDLVQAWIQRDDAPYGYPLRGRQSYFDEACYQRFDHAGREIEEDDPDCHIKRYGSINAIATGDKTVVIGGFLRKELRPAKYSAAGPITPTRGAANPHRYGPDALAVSDDSIVHNGVLAAGTRSGSVLAMRGTSVAAPQITRWIADRLAQGQPGDRAAVCAQAQSEEVNRPPPKTPRERLGCGRIERPPIIPLPRY